MAQVIVTHGDDANRWARQFCRELAWTRGRGMPPATGRRMEVVRSMSRNGIVEACERAARTAGTGGEVIYSIGHGNPAAIGATAQLGEGSELTINQEILQADANGQYGSPSGPTGRVTLSAQDQAINIAFRRIGAALTSNSVAKFIFLVCKLGSNRTFLQSIKTYWGGTVQVAGYTNYIATTLFTQPGNATYPRVSLYLSSDASGNMVVPGTNAEPATFLELPGSQHLVSI